MDQKYIVAIELSGSQVKGAAASVTVSPFAPLAIPSVEAIVYEDKVTCVQYGRVQNVMDAAKDVALVIKKLENHPALKGGKVTAAYVALAGRSLGSVQTTAELTLPSEMEITDDIHRRLLIEATKSVSGDKKVLRVVPRKYIIDNQVSQNPIGTVGTTLKGEFTVVTCNPVNRRNLENVLDNRVHLPVREYVVTPLAIADMVLGEEEKQLGCVLVDLGAQTTTVSIYKDRALQYLATLPLGSANITRDLAIGLSITDERAEIAKRGQGNALPDNASDTDEATRINCYVQARTGEIVANIMAQIGFAGFKPADLTAGFIVCGRGSKLKNLCQYLEKESKMKARRASTPATVNVVDASVDAFDYLPLISIVARAARVADPEGCVELPQAEHADVPEAEQVPSYHGYDDADDANDLYWNMDDDDAAKRRARQAADAEAKRQKEAAKAAAKAQREKAAADKKQAREQAREERARSGGLLKSIRDKLNNVFTYDPENDDTPID